VWKACRAPEKKKYPVARHAALKKEVKIVKNVLKIVRFAGRILLIKHFFCKNNYVKMIL